MMKHFDSFVRKFTVICSAGMLLQAGGCSTDLATNGTALFGLMLQRLVTDVVFGAFNVSTRGF